MSAEELAHREKGLSRILSQPWAYNLFQDLVGKKQTRVAFVERYVCPQPGCRILDIGCGTARILSYLPDSIAEYTGFDMNELYINYARELWSNRDNCAFFCQKIKETSDLKEEHYDVVIARNIVHHISDSEAAVLFGSAYHTLKPNGVLITRDNVYVDGQHWLAKWIISRDRGRAVRTVDGYKQLAEQYFADVESDISHDSLRIPYTLFTMKCVKHSSVSQC